MYFEPINVPRRKTKREVEEELCYVSGVDYYNARFERLDERPIAWKHSCTAVGVQIYRPLVYYFEDGDVLEYIVCHICGKIIYYPHF